MLILSEKCVKCMSCFEVCPVGAIRKLEDGNIKIDQGLCLGCGCCASSCPNSAISFD